MENRENGKKFSVVDAKEWNAERKLVVDSEQKKA
jgi:hypothetical protein